MNLERPTIDFVIAYIKNRWFKALFHVQMRKNEVKDFFHLTKKNGFFERAKFAKGQVVHVFRYPQVVKSATSGAGMTSDNKVRSKK